MSCLVSIFFRLEAGIPNFIFHLFFPLDLTFFILVLLPLFLPSYTSVIPNSSCLSAAFRPQLLTVHHQGRSSPIGRTARDTTVLSACRWRMLGTRGTRSVSVCIWPTNTLLIHSFFRTTQWYYNVLLLYHRPFFLMFMWVCKYVAGLEPWHFGGVSELNIICSGLHNSLICNRLLATFCRNIQSVFF